MKRLSVFLISLALIGLAAGCDIFGSKDPPGGPAPKLKDLKVTGLYANGDHVVAATGNYLFLSADNGKSWRKVTTTYVRSDTIPFCHFCNLAPVPKTTLFGNGNTVFAGVNIGLHGGVLVSTDNGRTWAERDLHFMESVNCFARIDGTVFAGTGDGVFKSADNGKSWTPVDTAGMKYQVDVLTKHDMNLFAGTGEGIFGMSTKGTDWNAVGLPGHPIFGLATIGSRLFAGAYHAPHDSTNGIFVSTDNGKSWKVLNHHLIGNLYSEGSNLFVGANTGTYVSRDQGSSWALLDSADATCFAANDLYLFIGTDNGVRRYPLSRFSK